MEIGRRHGDVYSAFIAVNHGDHSGNWDYSKLRGGLPQYGVTFSAFTDTVRDVDAAPEQRRFRVVASHAYGAKWTLMIAQFNRHGEPRVVETLPPIDEPGYDPHDGYHTSDGRWEVAPTYRYYNFFLADQMVRRGLERVNAAIALHLTDSSPDRAAVGSLVARRRELEDLRGDFARAKGFPWMQEHWECSHEPWPSSRQ